MQNPGGVPLQRKAVPRLSAVLTALTSLSVGVYTRHPIVRKFASGALRMPNLLRLTAVAAAALLSFTPLATSAQERTQEKETKTVEKEKPGEPTPPPAKEE